MSSIRGFFLHSRIEVIVQAGVGCAKELKWLLPLCGHPLLYGFEPSPRARGYWDSNIYPGILFSVGLGSSRRKVILNEPGRFEKSSMIHKPTRSRPIEVDIDTLDCFRRKFGPLGKKVMLWMDCEGSEIDVIRGAREFLRDTTVVVSEVVDAPTNGWPNRKQLHCELAKHGFRPIFEIKRCGEVFIR